MLALPPGDIRRGLPLTAQPFPPEIPAGLPAALLERRPDIRQAEEVLVAANARIGAAKALYFPTFSLTGFLGLESDDLKDFVSASARTWCIGLGLLQPIFYAGRIRSFNEAAAARQLQTLAQYEQVIQTAFREVSDALVGYRKTREQRVQQELLVEALADSAALANTRFLGGIDSYLQVLDAERQLFDAELELTRVRANELLNLVQLYKALGGGWQPDDPRQARPLHTAPRREDRQPTLRALNPRGHILTKGMPDFRPSGRSHARRTAMINPKIIKLFQVAPGDEGATEAARHRLGANGRDEGTGQGRR